MMIEGDIGAREIINKNAERVLYAKLKDPLCFFDIDTPEDLENLKPRID
jgi:CTP:molybdopterin cytidylyltransferase MocA